MQRKIISEFTATTLQELIENLQKLSAHHDTTYVTIDSGSVEGQLVEETLTDGSKVYNVELSDVCG